MRFLINKRLHINMGNYESVEITGSVEVDTNVDRQALVDLGVEPDTPDDVIDFVLEQLDVMLQPGAEEARLNTDESDSFIHPYLTDLQKKNGKRN